jgi:hypothetical protein
VLAAVLGGALHPWPPLPWFRRGDRLWSWSGGRGRCREVAGRQRCAQGWGRELGGGIAMAEWTEENNEYPTASRRRRARRGKQSWLPRALVFIVRRARQGARSREAAAGVCHAAARGARMRACAPRCGPRLVARVEAPRRGMVHSGENQGVCTPGGGADDTWKADRAGRNWPVACALFSFVCAPLKL